MIGEVVFFVLHIQSMCLGVWKQGGSKQANAGVDKTRLHEEG